MLSTLARRVAPVAASAAGRRAGGARGSAVFGARLLQQQQRVASLSTASPSVRPAEEDSDPGPGVIEKYQLHEPMRYVPLGVGIFGTLSLTGLYHWNEESQLLGLFLLFVGTIYAKGGDAIGAALDEVGDAILKEHHALEDKLAESLRAAKVVQEDGLKNYDQVVALYEDFIELAADINKAQPMLTHVQVNEQVEKLMQIFVSQEAKLASETERLVVDGAASAVRAAFQADPALQSAAMDSAFAALSNPEGQAKEDVVGELFKQFFADFRKAAWEDRAANPVVPVSAEVRAETEAVRKQLVGALEGVPDAEKLFAPLGDKFDLVADGLEGAVVGSTPLEQDARYAAAVEDNSRFMAKKDFEAWKASSASLQAKDI